MQDENKFAHSVVACLERSQAYRRVACARTVTFSFLETRHHQMARNVRDETMCSCCSPIVWKLVCFPRVAVAV
jgi:hypothetical protein